MGRAARDGNFGGSVSSKIAKHLNSVELAVVTYALA
jgi:hypothetical protein